MFMQAGFAFLEAGLTRMKNVGHIAAKNVLVLAIASLVYYVVGFGIAFGDGGNGLWGGSGFLPSVDELLTIGAVSVQLVLCDSRRPPDISSRSSSARSRWRSCGARWRNGRGCGSTSPSASPTR